MRNVRVPTAGPAAPQNAKNREKVNTPLAIFPNEISDRTPATRLEPAIISPDPHATAWAIVPIWSFGSTSGKGSPLRGCFSIHVARALR